MLAFEIIILPLLLLVPGRLVLCRKDGFSTAEILGLSCIISSLLIGLLNLFLSLFFPIEVLWLFHYVLIFTVVFCFLKLSLWRLEFWVGDKSEQHALFGLIVIYILFSSLLLLSPYPAHLSYNLGDWPEYYHAANRVASGLSWQPNFLSADYHLGWLAYLKIHSLLIYSNLQFFTLFEGSLSALHLYCFFIASICLFTFGSRVVSRNKFLLLLVCLLPIVFQKVFMLFGLGLVTMPVLLSLLLLFSLRSWLVLPVLLYLSWSRPEGFLFSLIYLSIICFNLFLQRHKTPALISATILLILLSFNMDKLIGALVARHQNAAISYLEYDKERGSFDYTFGDQWYRLNREFHKLHFTPQVSRNLVNHEVAVEVQQNFAAFIGFTFNQAVQNFSQFLKIFNLSLHAVLLVILFIGFFILFKKEKLLSLYLAILALIFSWSIFNPTIGQRHILPFGIVLFLPVVTYLLSFVARVNKSILLTSYALLFVFISLNSFKLADERQKLENKSYQVMLQSVEKHVPKGKILLSSYPQLVSLLTKRAVVGGTALFAQRFMKIASDPAYCDSYLLLDGFRSDTRDGYQFYLDSENKIKKYWQPIYINRAWNFVLLGNNICNSRSLT